MAALLIIAGLLVPACSSPPKSQPGHEAPAVIGKANSDGVKSVELTRQAFDRLGIETVQVRESQSSATPSPRRQRTGGTGQSAPVKIVPYSAVLYTPDGVSWVYTAPRPMTYIREKVVVATVGGANGTEAVLSQGPAAGTTIVTTGVMELYGAELGVGK